MINLAICFIEFAITLSLDFVNVPIPLKLNTKSHQPVVISLARVLSTKKVIHMVYGIFPCLLIEMFIQLIKIKPIYVIIYIEGKSFGCRDDDDCPIGYICELGWCHILWKTEPHSPPKWDLPILSVL